MLSYEGGFIMDGNTKPDAEVGTFTDTKYSPKTQRNASQAFEDLKPKQSDNILWQVSFTKNGSEILFYITGADCIHLYDLIGEHLTGTDLSCWTINHDKKRQGTIQRDKGQWEKDKDSVKVQTVQPKEFLLMNSLLHAARRFNENQ